MFKKVLITNDALITLDLPPRLLMKVIADWLSPTHTTAGVNYGHNLVADSMLFSMAQTIGDHRRHQWSCLAAFDNEIWGGQTEIAARSSH